MHVITLKKQFLKVDVLIFFSFPDLPSLTTIELKEGALQGNGNTDRVASEEEPYYYKNTLIMRSIICDCKCSSCSILIFLLSATPYYNYRLTKSFFIPGIEKQLLLRWLGNSSR